MVHAGDDRDHDDHPDPSISVLFTLPRDTLPRISLAMAAGKRGDRLRTSKLELDQGTLLTPDNSIDATTGTIKLKATFPNQKHPLARPVRRARLRLGTGTNVWCRRLQCSMGRMPYVYIVKPDSTVARQDVEVARDNDARIGDHQGWTTARSSSPTVSRACSRAPGWRPATVRQAAAKTGG
jgi:hypothetical protein